eukprot:SAG25_NODE_272_length_10613_cov_6.416191_19_plen_67_part_00
MTNDHLETEQLEHQRQLLQAKRAERQREANVRISMCHPAQNSGCNEWKRRGSSVSDDHELSNMRCC